MLTYEIEKYMNGEFLVSDEYRRLLSEKNRICQLLDRKEKEPDDPFFFWNWKYKYESPFRTWTAESGDTAAKISEFRGNLWAIPCDGRVSLLLTPKSLSSMAEGNQVAILQTLTRLQRLDIDFRKRQGCGFWVIDNDPWEGQMVIYGDTPLMFSDTLKEMPTLKISWQNQALIPPRYVLRVFQCKC
jgi:hypothetical protein